MNEKRRKKPLGFFHRVFSLNATCMATIYSCPYPHGIFFLLYGILCCCGICHVMPLFRNIGMALCRRYMDVSALACRNLGIILVLKSVFRGFSVFCIWWKTREKKVENKEPRRYIRRGYSSCIPDSGIGCVLS